MNPADVFLKVTQARELLQGENVREYGPSFEFTMPRSFSITGPTLLKLCAILWGLEFEILAFEDQVTVHVDKPIYNTATGKVNTGEL